MPTSPELHRLEAAVRLLLEGCGAVGDAEVHETPARVARLWHDELLAGLRLDPRVTLAQTTQVSDGQLIIVRDLAFHSLCPHHLMPSRGRAHLGYAARARAVGFGQLAELVDWATRRLTLQERATSAIADALVAHLGAHAACCVLDAEHLCLALPGDRHEQSRALTCACAGDQAIGALLREQLLR